MSWGNNFGCSFLEIQCAGIINAAYFRMFCDAADKLMHCASDRQALGKCIRNVGNGAAKPSEWCAVPLPLIGYDGNYDGCCTCTLKGSDAFHGPLSGKITRGAWIWNHSRLVPRRVDHGKPVSTRCVRRCCVASMKYW
ncbi:putative surface protease GP63 [Trypanosoma rangeli]|uniref:Leishmanolysin-like peptidase n=1 Tax=Trypanosoma rangeli TaxID=5698 RepID=A0A422MTW8_TRYRA|nr:putative surface protease GP63 [Trypanosoma rangeli]RNE96621.1 putative surface protease GP63 [Trypanosoma rangeli]|eukprot:RNE96621.1 putative surface protease GP63 [Trypanosoma rangeli]